MARYLLVYFFNVSVSAFGFLKKAIIVFTVFATVICFFVLFRSGEKLPTIYSYNSFEKEVEDTIAQLETDTTQEGQVSLAMYKTSMCMTIGEACNDDQEGVPQGGYLTAFSNMLTIPYRNPPASGIAWVQNGLEDAGFVPNTYAAAGLGFSSIAGYLEIWKVFRDISYLLLVLVLIAIGFMIMFRVNIGGQTIVNIENSLPRIVIAMLMITFSFAISGFLIDMMYALIALAVGLLYNVGELQTYASTDIANLDGKATAGQALYEYMNAGFWELWPDGGGSYYSVGYSFWNLVPTAIQGIFRIVFGIPWAVFTVRTLTFIPSKLSESISQFSLAGFSLGNIPQTPVVILAAFILGLLTFIGPGIIFGAIIVLTVIMFMFRLFFMLLQSYIKILIYILFSPIILLFSAIPGNGNIGWWLRNLIGELMTFPTLVAISLVGNAVMSVAKMSIATDVPSGYYGALSTQTHLTLPFLYGFTPEDFNMIVSLGLILMIPDLVKMVKEWIGVKDSPFKLGIGTFFASAGAIAGGGLQGASRFGSLAQTMPGLTRWLETSALRNVPGISLFTRGNAELPPNPRTGQDKPES